MEARQRGGAEGSVWQEYRKQDMSEVQTMFAGHARKQSEQWAHFPVQEHRLGDNQEQSLAHGVCTVRSVEISVFY